MITGRPKPALTLTPDEHTQLRSWAGSRTLPHALVAPARLVLWSVQGQNNSLIARRLHWTKATVGKWRQRFVEYRLAGLYDELRPGRPRSIDDEQIAALLKRTLSRRPGESTHWSIRQAAQASGISRSTVHRVFQTFGVQPHRTRSFKLHRSVLYREGARHCRLVSASPRSRVGALRR